MASGMLADGLSDNGWDVEVATEKQEAEKVRVEGELPIHEFSMQGTPSPCDCCRGEIDRYHRLLIEGGWDLIIFQGYAWPLYLGLSVLNKITAKTILVSHGYGALVWTPVRKMPYGLGQLLRSALQSIRMFFWIKKIDRLVFLSKRCDLINFYDHTLARIAGHPGIEIIPNGVNADVVGATDGFRERINVSDGAIVFLCVANYSRRKDQGYAARAYRRAAIQNSILVFIGSEFNEYSKEFQEQDALMTKESGPGQILWLENLDRETTLQAFAECDICILSGRHEAQPIVLLEAMSHRKPWIARNAGCISEMEGGLCVQSEAEMTEAMIKLSSERNVREKLAIGGRLAIENRYNRKSYNTSYIRLIEELIL